MSVCNLTLRSYQQDLFPELAARRMALVAISPQPPDGSLSMQEKNKLTFTVLSDPGNQIASALGLLTAPSSEARSAQLVRITVPGRRRLTSLLPWAASKPEPWVVRPACLTVAGESRPASMSTASTAIRLEQQTLPRVT